MKWLFFLKCISLSALASNDPFCVYNLGAGGVNNTPARRPNISHGFTSSNTPYPTLPPSIQSILNNLLAKPPTYPRVPPYLPSDIDENLLGKETPQLPPYTVEDLRQDIEEEREAGQDTHGFGPLTIETSVYTEILNFLDLYVVNEGLILPEGRRTLISGFLRRVFETARAEPIRARKFDELFLFKSGDKILLEGNHYKVDFPLRDSFKKPKS